MAYMYMLLDSLDCISLFKQKYD